MYRPENNRLELYNAAVDAGWVQVKNLPSSSLKKLIDTGDRTLYQIMKYSDRSTIQNTLLQFYKIPLSETRKLSKTQLQILLETNYAKDGINIPSSQVIYPKPVYPPVVYLDVASRPNPPPLPPPPPPPPPAVNLRPIQPSLQRFITSNNFEIDQNTFRSLV